MIELNVSEVKFREDLYPRIHTSAETVQKYAEDLDVLPPIEVNQHQELIDGWHHWTAHKKNKAETIRAEVSLETLIQILGFDLHPDTLQKIDLRRHYATQRIVETERVPLGFFTERLVVKKS